MNVGGGKIVSAQIQPAGQLPCRDSPPRANELPSARRYQLKLNTRNPAVSAMFSKSRGGSCVRPKSENIPDAGGHEVRPYASHAGGDMDQAEAWSP